MTAKPIQLAADALHEARRTRTPIARVSETFGIAGPEAAYAVAAANTRRALAEGRVLSGKKIGLTSRAVQQQLGVDQPDFGVLFADMEYVSGAEIPASALIQPKAEGEIAFVIGRDLDEAPTWGRFLRAVEYALPAIEIVDSAIADWRITLVDTVADNASCGLTCWARTRAASPTGAGGLRDALHAQRRTASEGSGAAAWPPAACRSVAGAHAACAGRAAARGRRGAVGRAGTDVRAGARRCLARGGGRPGEGAVPGRLIDGRKRPSPERARGDRNAS